MTDESPFRSKKEVSEALSTAIDMLYEIRKERMSRSEMLLSMMHLTDYQYLRENNTIAVNAGRQSSKTSWIAANGWRDLVIVARDVSYTMHHLVTFNPRFAGKVYSIDKFVLLCDDPAFAKLVKDHKRIIVDDASWCFDKVKQKRFYNQVAKVFGRDIEVLLLG